MTATTTGYLIPYDGSQPIKKVYIDENLSGVSALIFQPELETDGMLGVSSVRSAGIQFIYDDMGLYNQPDNVNDRAMKLWANAAGVPVNRFVTKLVGNYVVMGLDPNDGESIDVPADIENKLTSDWLETK